MAKVSWTKLRNEYINGEMSYRKLAIKHGVSYQRICQVGSEEGWTKLRKEQRKKISCKLEQKTAEKIADKEAERMARIITASDQLLEKLEAAIAQLDTLQLKDKRRYTQTVIDKKTGKEISVYIEEEVPKTSKTEVLDRYGMRQIASTLKDIKDIQMAKSEDKQSESPEIKINISAATLDDVDGDED